MVESPLLAQTYLSLQVGYKRKLLSCAFDLLVSHLLNYFYPVMGNMFRREYGSDSLFVSFT